MSILWATVKGVGRLFKILVILITTFLGVVFVGVIVAYFYFAKDLPNIQTVSDYHPQLVSHVYGSDGTLIGEFWSDERRELIAISDVPPLVINTVIAAEDSRFREHRGVDFRSIIRAVIANFKAGGIVQGASTITQQVTRSLLLSRTQSYDRKIKEAILANRLERYLTKDQILYLYLNQIYFGNRAYGIKAASENYFKKKIEELNLAEIAFLVAMPRAPELYSPFKYPQHVRERQRYVLDRLVEEGFITQGEKQRAFNTKLTVYKQGVDKDTNLKHAPYFMEYLRQYLLKKYGNEKLYYGSLNIYTSIDPSMQKAAQKALRRGLEVVDRRRIGWRGPIEHVQPEEIHGKKEQIHRKIMEQLLEISIPFPPETPSRSDPTPVEAGKVYSAVVTGFKGQDTEIAIGRTGGIVERKDISFDEEKLSYTENLYIYDPPRKLKIGDVIQVRAEEDGSYSFYQKPLIQGALYAQETATGLARAMVGGYDFSDPKSGQFNRAMDALRQTGSAFKPFVYAAALDKGYTFNTPVYDTPFVIPIGRQIWAPKNYDGNYRGLTTVHQAIVHSYNVAAARVAYHVGFDYLTAYERKLGITTPIQKVPSMALGANGIHLYELVAAYATFPNLGVYRPPAFITKILDHEGNLLEENQHLTGELDPKTVLEKELALIENPDELNSDLFENNKMYLEKDQLNLSPSEMMVLYGSSIPPGHVMTPQTAYLMVQLMSDVVEKGTGQRVKKLKKPAGGKTGTTNDVTDTWFVGYVPDLAAGVWVGYDEIQTIGKGEQGGRTAAPIFLDFMQEATKDWEAKPFPVPDEVKGHNIATLAGGSARHAELMPFPVFSRDAFMTGGSSQDRSADFLEADFESFPFE